MSGIESLLLAVEICRQGPVVNLEGPPKPVQIDRHGDACLSISHAGCWRASIEIGQTTCEGAGETLDEAVEQLRVAVGRRFLDEAVRKSTPSVV